MIFLKIQHYLYFLALVGSILTSKQDKTECCQADVTLPVDTKGSLKATSYMPSTSRRTSVQPITLIADHETSYYDTHYLQSTLAVGLRLSTVKSHIGDTPDFTLEDGVSFSTKDPDFDDTSDANLEDTLRQPTVKPHVGDALNVTFADSLRLTTIKPHVDDALNDTLEGGLQVSTTKPRVDEALNATLKVGLQLSTIKPYIDEATLNATLKGGFRVSTMKPLFQLDTCREFGTCKSVSALQFKFCHCDEVCHIYKDCCHDVPHYVPSNETLVNVSSDMNSMVFQCLKLSTLDPYRGALVVTRCPENSNNSEIDMQCMIKDILKVGPWVVDDNGIIFQNKHCAECWNRNINRTFSVKISNIKKTFISNSINTTSSDRIQTLMMQSYSDDRKATYIEMIPPNNFFLRACMIYEKPMVDSKKCQSYFTNPIFLPSELKIVKLQQNSFCVPNDELYYCIGQYLDALIDSLENGNYLHDVHPLSVMFTFQQEDTKCVQKVGGFCLNQDSFKDYPITLTFSLDSTAFLPNRQVKQLLLAFAWSLSSDVKLVSLGFSESVQINKSTYSRMVSMDILIIKQANLHDILQYEKCLLSLKWSSTINLRDSEEIVTSTSYVEQNVSRRLSSYTYKDVNLMRTLQDNDVRVPPKTSIRLLCGHILVEWETDNLLDNGSLTVYNVECLFQISGIPKSANHDVIKTVLTYCGLGISILALSGSSIIYRTIGFHKSVPGTNLENLSLSLLISNLVFLAGVGANDFQIICYISGVLLHYLWLSVFSFSSIALVHMCHTFKQITVNSTYQSCAKVSSRVRFTVLGFFLPGLFVVPGIAVDYFYPNRYALKYNGTVCFPTGFPGNLIFVFAPIGCSLIVNVFCFMRIVTTIAKQKIMSRHIRTSNSFHFVSVFLRISTATGVFWITGVLWAVFPNEVIEYIFILCCSFQGFFVALSNMTTNRVRKKIKERFSKS